MNQLAIFIAAIIWFGGIIACGIVIAVALAALAAWTWLGAVKIWLATQRLPLRNQPKPAKHWSGERSQTNK